MIRNQKQIKIKIKSNLKKELDSFVSSVKTRLEFLSIEYKTFNMPTKESVFTFLRSPHVHKKSKDQYALKTFETTISLNNVKENIDFTERFLVDNKPFGVKVSLVYTK